MFCSSWGLEAKFDCLKLISEKSVKKLEKAVKRGEEKRDC